MKILAIGDIVGEKALEKVEKVLPELIKNESIEFVIANGENIVEARGINKQSFERLIAVGVNAVTMGNHTYSNKGIYEIDDSRLIIPVNYSKDTIDKGYNVFEVNKNKIFVANALGKRLGGTLNGFNVIDNIVSNLNSDIKIRIIDFHSEYGNEKAAMAHMLKDKVSVVYGTHTHIQTADEKIINSGEGFISDIGMCGPVNSGIGYDLDFEVKRYKEELEDDSKLSNDTNCIFSACMFEIDNNTGKTLTIKRILM